ncbi:hypothetical protein K1T71_000176 [Dendrolimus kikuchii]|uniref:Uncharacterized protein n=1 Tax=Dendrolimus kikuchii TaxID=765133 RepID=A0ACC1DIF2_9NEOP|nr:hypothetical protein K1T71_000176 [Dendrolimus kikuchii]
MILKMKEFCEAEHKNHGVLIPINNVRKRVAAMTGINIGNTKKNCKVIFNNNVIKYENNHSNSFILLQVCQRKLTRVTKEGATAASTSKVIVTPGKSHPHTKKLDLDGFDLCAIRQKIHSFYVVRKELLTLAKLRTSLREDINFQGSITTLHRILQSIGLKYKRCQSKRKLLMERYDITAWRSKYLERIRRSRNVQKKHVVYLDETYIHNTYHAKSCWQIEEEPAMFVSESSGSRWIIAHAGTENGFVNGALLMLKSIYYIHS